jgi:hypothetical protein
MYNKILTFLVITLLSFFVFSFESEATTSIDVISTSNIKMMPTSSFDVDISVLGSDRLIGFQFKLLYDQTKFKLNSITVSSEFNLDRFTQNTTKAGEIIVNYVDYAKVITQEQAFSLFKLNFTALEGITEGDHDLLSLDSSYLAEFITMTTNYVLSSIETINFNFSKVNRPLRGDINFDGKVDAKDALSIQLHLASLGTPLNEVQLLNADLNGDGNITIFDVARIQLFLADLIMTL